MEQNLHNLLRNDIQSKFGSNILGGKDCSALIDEVNKDTRRLLSISTVKRFFGILKSKVNPSRYTLETFALYLGFNSLEEYVNCFKNIKHTQIEGTWETVKRRIQLITSHSLESLKQKTRYNPEKTIFRTFTKELFENFLKSSGTATMLIGPNGYGKSTALIQIVENFFVGADAPYKNDIVALIDGGIFFNLFSKNTNIELLNQILEYKISSSAAFHFQNNPSERKGRIWLMIDQVDEIFFDKERYHHLAENLARIIMANYNDWYKVILTCRPENVGIFAHLTKKYPVLKDCWYDIDFEQPYITGAMNIPLFSESEIDKLLKKLKFNLDLEKFKDYNNVLEIIQHPFFLSLFIKDFNLNEKVSEQELLKYHFIKRLYSPPNINEKIFLIERFIELCERGKEKSSVAKNELLVSNHYESAYRELVADGILYEYTIPEKIFGVFNYVKFRQKITFEFLLFEKWRQNRSLDIELFNEIRNYYQDNIQLQCNLLKFFIRSLAHENKLDKIKVIKTSLFEKSANTSQEDTFCINVLIALINKLTDEL